MYMLSILIFIQSKFFFKFSISMYWTLFYYANSSVIIFEDMKIVVAIVTVKLKIFSVFQLTAYKLWKFCCVLRCCRWEGNSRVCHHPMMGYYLNKFCISHFTYYKIVFQILERYYSKVKEVYNHLKVFLI